MTQPCVTIASPLLGQSPASQSIQILWTLGWLVGAVIVLIAAILLIRRWLVGKPDDQPMGLTMGDLRRMRDEGHLSDEEYQATRQTLIAKSRGGEAAGERAQAGRPVSDQATPEPGKPADEWDDQPAPPPGDEIERGEGPDPTNDEVGPDDEDHGLSPPDAGESPDRP